ncbi:hypothetical protein Lser_V15G20908 [Lactuca serriola]
MKMMRHPNIFRLHEESECEDDEIVMTMMKKMIMNKKQRQKRRWCIKSLKNFCLQRTLIDSCQRRFPEYRDGCAHVLGQQIKSHPLLEFIRKLMALRSAFILYGSVGGPSKTVVLLAYECPQEIDDSEILVRSGFIVFKATFFNFLSALVALAGTALVHFHRMLQWNSSICILLLLILDSQMC